MWLCSQCHAYVHQLVREGQLDLAARRFFSEERAALYGRERGTVDAELVDRGRRERAALIRAIEVARREARDSGDVERQRAIEALSVRHGLRY